LQATASIIIFSGQKSLFPPVWYAGTHTRLLFCFVLSFPFFLFRAAKFKMVMIEDENTLPENDERSTEKGEHLHLHVHFWW
jgi:hypothetical protein